MIASLLICVCFIYYISSITFNPLIYTTHIEIVYSIRDIRANGKVYYIDDSLCALRFNSNTFYIACIYLSVGDNLKYIYKHEDFDMRTRKHYRSKSYFILSLTSFANISADSLLYFRDTTIFSRTIL